MQQIADVVRDELACYFEHLASRVERAVRSLPKEKLWVKPFAFGNSVGHLVLHLTGSLSYHIGTRFAGTGYVRDRHSEFTDANEEAPELILHRFREAVQLVVATLRSQSEAEFMQAVPDQSPAQTRLGLFVVCASHMNNHVGQMA